MEKSIINAVLRLERAGAENSRATEKLHEAARVVAGLIEAQCPVGVQLPRGYQVHKMRSNVGSELFLLRDDGPDKDAAGYGVNVVSYLYIDGTGGYLHGDFNCKVPAQTRRGSLQFAQDVAEGLLDEIAEFLENRRAEAEQAVVTLESVAANQHAS